MTTTSEATIRDDEAGTMTLAPYQGEGGGYALWHRGEVVWRSANADGAWQALPGPTLERVMVAGWQSKNHRTAGYWWIYEDATDEHGKPMEYPSAIMWRRFPSPPSPPTSEKTDAE